jgi:hypothetical protein
MAVKQNLKTGTRATSKLFFVLMALLVGILAPASRAQASLKLKASPSTCTIPPGANTCSTSVSWNTGNSHKGKVVVNGQLWKEGKSGTETADGLQAGKTYKIDLYDGSSVLKSIIVQAKTSASTATHTPTPTPAHTASHTPSPTPAHTATHTPTPAPTHTPAPAQENAAVSCNVDFGFQGQKSFKNMTSETQCVSEAKDHGARLCQAVNDRANCRPSGNSGGSICTGLSPSFTGVLAFHQGEASSTYEVRVINDSFQRCAVNAFATSTSKQAPAPQATPTPAHSGFGGK